MLIFHSSKVLGMAKNSFCCPSFLEERNIIHQCQTTTSTMQFQELPANSFQYEGYPSWSSAEDRAASPSHSHRQAEKRRRDRINSQLARLRKLVPMSEKMDKAALLERVVDEVKDLKKNATEISKFLTIPTETDDITIECHTNIQEGFPVSHMQDNKSIMLYKATVCCEDRPDLIAELIRALKGLNLNTVGADFACLGGRMKCILILYYKVNGDGENQGVCNISAIKQSLMAVLSRVVSWSASSTSNFRVTSKRQRFFFSS